MATTTEVTNVRRPFDPQAHDLDPNFRLTKYTELSGSGCKVPQEALNKYLDSLKQQQSALEAEQAHFQYLAASPKLGGYKMKN